MKLFRKPPGRSIFTGVFLLSSLAIGVISSALALRLIRVPLLSAAMVTYPSLSNWLENIEAGSKLEAALFRRMGLPTGDVLFRRPPREAQPGLTALIKEDARQSALYSLRALQDEQALDFTAAEADWKAWVEYAPDQAAAEQDLADFYSRRLRPRDQIEALEAVAQAPTPPEEKFAVTAQQRSWRAFSQILDVVQSYALGTDVADHTYRLWIARYPAEPEVYSRFFAVLLDEKRYDDAVALVAQYRKVFPQDTVFPVKARASIAYHRGGVAEGLAVYDKAFQPLWPAGLVQSYYNLLTETRSLPAYIDRTRAALSANPDDMDAAARLFYAYQQTGRLDAARQVIAEYRESKESRKAPWTAQELYTFARILEAVESYPESARYYFALYNSQGMPDAQERALAGLVGVLLSAPEQPVRLGAGNLSMYRDIATMDQGPGYLNGILSLFLNTTDPRGEYASEDQLATPYFHRAEASELLAQLDRRFPNAPERAELHYQLIAAYTTYGEDEAVIRAGSEFLAQFPGSPRRVDVALSVADAYARNHRVQEEFAIYDKLLRELAAQAEGVPLGDGSARYSKPVSGQPPVASLVSTDSQDENAQESGGEKPAEQLAFSTGTSAAAATGARSPQYEQVLNRYLARLVAVGQLPQALAVLRGEVDHDPNDPGIYEKLAQFLEQNQLGEHEEEVYKRAISQFGGNDWYAKLARFYLRRRRNADYAALTEQVAKVFSGTELETYLADASAPGPQLALQVNLYAHNRFPHDLAFTENLLALYRVQHGPTRNEAAAEALLAGHWFESDNLRDEFFELLAKNGKLDAMLATLRSEQAGAAKEDWAGLASRNPAAALFLTDAGLWQSHFEQCAPAAGALAAEYPADQELEGQASSLYRSLAYFHPEDTALAVTIEKRLLDADPGDLNTLARIGDTYADRGLYADATPYWLRMADVRSGESDGYLQSATVFWDYFDFAHALSQLDKGRKALANPSLYSYEEGAIYENERDYPKAIAEYVRGATAPAGDAASRNRLLVLAARPSLEKEVDAATVLLLTKPNPTLAEISLRIDILNARPKKAGLEAALNGLLDRSASFDVLEYVAQFAQQQSLVAVEQHSLQRQIAITTDPLRKTELRYDLIHFYENNGRIAEAQSEIDALYQENPKIMGVVRATVDFDWSHDRKPQAIAALEQAASAAYPALERQFNFEAARKLTDLGQYAQARSLLNSLLEASPYDSEYMAAIADTYGRDGDDNGLRDFYQTQIAALKNASMDRAGRTTKIAALRRGLIPALTRLKQPDTAVDQYIELINAYPDDAGLASEAALYAARHQQQPKLLDFYRKTVKDSPRDSRWFIVLARLETALEDYPAAIDAYSQAISIRPDRVDLYTARASLNEKLQHYDAAVADYEKLYTLSYKDPSWMESAAAARARQGKADLAAAALRTALIDGKEAKPSGYFEAARRLESWNMLNQAMPFASKGIELAGADLLADPANHSGAVTYARILTRMRKPEVAYAKLEEALTAAGAAPGISATFEHVAANGFAGLTENDWRRQQRAARLAQGRQGFAAAFKEMAATAHLYFTPEETASFAQMLQAKSAAATDADLQQFFLPAAEAGELTELEAGLQWKLANSKSEQFRYTWRAWVELQRSRLLLNQAAKQLEELIPTVRASARSEITAAAAELYRDAGDQAGELRCLQSIPALAGSEEDLRQQYFALLIARDPQKLIDLAGSGSSEARDAAAQYAVLNAPAAFALQAVRARGTGLDPVWTSAYGGITGLYLRQFDSTTGGAFQSALGDGTIAERLATPPDRSRQLAGDSWFYYGARYGEYLSFANSPEAADFLPASLEQEPENASAYGQLAAWYTDRGKPAQALEEYNLALQLDPNDPVIYDSIAILLWNEGKRAEARESWKKAVTLLVKENDARRVPDSFWTNFTTVIGHLGARKQLPAVRPQIDALLRMYIRRNGSYRTEPLLHAVYVADGNPQDATPWLLDLSAAGNPPNVVLDSVVISTWIPDAQRPRIYGRLVEIAGKTVDSSEGQARAAAEDHRRELRIQWLNALMKVDRYKEAQSELDAIPASEKKEHRQWWLPVEIKLAAHNGTLAAMVAQWKQDPASVPAAIDLRNLTPGLDPASQDLILEFVYQSAIDKNDLASANFIGLAKIRLHQGNVPAAVALLERLALVSENPYADLDAASALLVETGHDSEAIPFLSRLTSGVPWEPAYRLRLDVARIKVNQDRAAAIADLASITADQAAPYAVRAKAAEALAGNRASAASPGSEELNLLAQAAIRPSDAERPYFLMARVKAAMSAAPVARIELLGQALAIAPQDGDIRLELMRAAIEAKDAHLAINAAGSQLNQMVDFGMGNEDGDNSMGADEASGIAPNGVVVYRHSAFPAFERLSRDDRAQLYAGLAESYRKIGDLDSASGSFRQAIYLETDAVQRRALMAELDGVRHEVERRNTNAARAPTIHETLDQNHAVRPRLPAAAERKQP